jgi:hypothetical protein
MLVTCICETYREEVGGLMGGSLCPNTYTSTVYLHQQIFSGLVGMTTLASGMLATVLAYAVTQSYSLL